MRASVLHHIDRAVLVAYHDDRLLADESPLKVAGVGQLGVECDVAPARAAKDALLLPGIDLRVGVNPVGDAGNAFFGPHIARAHGFLSSRLRWALDRPVVRRHLRLRPGLDQSGGALAMEPR